MKTRYKIILIAGISVAVIIGIIIIGPVIIMIASIQYSGFIISSTPDEVFEDEFAGISEVAFFIEKYPDHTTSHLQDIIGWKIILYKAVGPDDKSIILEAKKNVLRQGIKINAGCDEDGDSSFALDIPQEQVMDFLKSDECLGK